MDLNGFGSLARRVAEASRRLRSRPNPSEGELVQLAARVIGGDVCVWLVRVDNSAATQYRRGLQSKPVSVDGADIEQIVGWYRNSPRNIDGYCLGRQGNIAVGDTQFVDAAVGFGRRHDLVVARFSHTEAPSPLTLAYDSHHAWAIAELVRAFEERAELVGLRDALLFRYRQDFGTILREDTPWAAVLQTVGSDDRDLLGVLGCEWLGLRVRTGRLPMPSNKAESSAGRVLQGDATKTPWAEVIELMTSPQRLVQACPMVFDALWKPEDSFRPAANPSARERADRTALVVLEHGWRLIKQVAERQSAPGQPWAKAAVDQVCGTLGVSLGDANAGKVDLPQETDKQKAEQLKSSARYLLKLSLRLFGRRVASGWNEACAGQPRKEGDDRSRPEGKSSNRMLLGRNVLWAYLGCQLASSERLRSTYLWQEPLSQPSAKDSRPPASDEACRDFLKHLSHFFLGLIERLQQYYNLDTKTRTATPADFLDGLIYLVDRYAHIQLGVPERLDLRHHLARATSSEVGQHLRSNYYRDHLLHVVDVFLLGHLLLKTKVPWTDKGATQGPLLERINQSCVHPAIPKDPGGKQRLGADAWLRNWAVASLLHDIGYQVQANRKIDMASDAYGEFFTLRATAPTSFLAFVPTSNRKEGIERHLKTLLDHLSDPVVNGGIPFPTVCSDERLNNHGVLSSMRLAQLLASMDPSPVRGLESSKREGDSSKTIGPTHLHDFAPAVHAIFMHDLQAEQVSASTHPLSCLLRLCDELQEWNRYRVDVEKMVKQLYIAVETEPSASLEKRRLLREIRANLLPTFTPAGSESAVSFDDLSFELSGGGGVGERDRAFCFELDYEAPNIADYDPIITLLSKAFNLQHLHMAAESGSDLCQLWRIELNFPSMDGGGRTEYDIYSQFAEEEARWLPMLSIAPDSSSASPGLMRLGRSSGKDDTPSDGYSCENPFVIVVDGNRDQEKRQGWLTSDPGALREQLKAFRDKKYRSWGR